MSRYRPNPKQVGSGLIDCNPQKGPCPIGCNECFYNRDKSLYKPNVPSKKIASGKIVRMNALHDSNIKRWIVLRAAKRYENVFFNTSIANFDDLPGPIVYTANSSEEQPVDMCFLQRHGIEKLMFVRLRVSPTNLPHICNAIRIMDEYSRIPVVLTFMRYYNKDMNFIHIDSDDGQITTHIRKKHITNSAWCATAAFKKAVLKMAYQLAKNPITMCGTINSSYCKDCHNCEIFYWQVYKRLKGIG